MGGVTGLVGADINAAPAWDITTGDSTLILAVLDSGIPAGTGEFTGRLMRGHDYVNNDSDPKDDHGHGSNVTGIAAATGNNGRLIAGVDWRCRILPMKILNDKNRGFYSWWMSALVAAADSGARVINMSVGGTGYSQGLQDAVTYAVAKGAIVVVSMMNENAETPFYPAAFPNVIAVGAINNRNARAVPFCWGSGGSNYGDHIDFMAPGERIYGLSHQYPNGYSIYCGTSQAAPHVSGVIMLLLAANPSLNYSQVYNLLKAGAHDQIGPSTEDTPGWDRYFGWGRVDALASLTQLVTGLAERRPGQPQGFQLLQNYPNPFNPATTIEYRIDQPGHVRLVIYNVTGQRVRTLVDEWQPAGHYQVIWDGFSDRRAFSVPAGVYLYELKRGDRVARKRLILLR
ncbi:MAG: S8 family serine peptidase [candidate division KSB1 bacterium]|nr:S8 family serine peptidase [candidate division KSB1 bacterium]